MKILLLHSTFWPLIGGTESIMRQHAEMLAEHGHDVRVVTGHGQPSNDQYHVEVLKELSPGFPLNLQAKRALDHGQTDQHLNTFTHLLTETLKPYYDEADLVITHGAVTTHFNLALTQAVWKLAGSKPTIAWVHDFTPANKNYALPNPGHMPWALMSQAHPQIKYVAVSGQRQQEITQTLGIEESQVPVIENGIDFNELLGIEPAFKGWLERIDFLSRDIIFFYPTKLLQRKNIDQAILWIDAIKKAGLNPLLLISGSQDVYGTAGASYEDYLKYFPKQLGLENEVFYLNDYNDEIGPVWQQAFRISDVLLFSSGYEGFGIPPLEAVATRIPCWCQPLGTIPDWLAPAMTFVKTPEEAAAAAQELASNPVFQARKRIWREHNWNYLYDKKIWPLLQSLLG